MKQEVENESIHNDQRWIPVKRQFKLVSQIYITDHHELNRWILFDFLTPARQSIARQLVDWSKSLAKLFSSGTNGDQALSIGWKLSWITTGLWLAGVHNVQTPIVSAG